jgi:hypothetical protein
VAACGEERRDEQPAAATATRAGATATATATAETVSTVPDAQIRNRAEAYIASMVDEDWKAACEAWAPSERQRLAENAGSCKRAFKVLFEGEKTVKKMFADTKAGAVRVRGGKASVDLMAPDAAKPVATLGAKIENGQWWLADLPESDMP